MVREASPLDDVYRDTDTHSLPSKDHQLRQRNGSWELKLPVVDCGGDNIGTTIDREVTELSDIRRLVKEAGVHEEMDEARGCPLHQSLIWAIT